MKAAVKNWLNRIVLALAGGMAGGAIAYVASLALGYVQSFTGFAVTVLLSCLIAAVVIKGEDLSRWFVYAAKCALLVFLLSLAQNIVGHSL